VARVHALNYERHQRVTSFTKHNLQKKLIAELYIRTLSIKLFFGAFLRNNYIDAFSITLVRFQPHWCAINNIILLNENNISPWFYGFEMISLRFLNENTTSLQF
jgi:hypothetical protein